MECIIIICVDSHDYYTGTLLMMLSRYHRCMLLRIRVMTGNCVSIILVYNCCYDHYDYDVKFQQWWGQLFI